MAEAKLSKEQLKECLAQAMSSPQIARKFDMNLRTVERKRPVSVRRKHGEVILMSKDAEEMLTQWGIWVWEGAGVPGYVSPMRVLMRDNVEQIGKPCAHITDEEAMRVDNIIGQLWSKSPLVADCLRVYYATERTQEQVGRLLGLPRLKVREYVLQGVAYVEGRLDEREAA